MARVMVIGGDGFIGWPLSLYLSARGADVTIVDDLSRRTIDAELDVQSLTPIETTVRRLITWKSKTANLITWVRQSVDALDPCKYLLDRFNPDSIVHLGKQKSAPYSMKSARHKCQTVAVNMAATNSLLAAMVETGRQDVPLIHMGTMGVYGYGTVPGVIPEGYLPVQIDGKTVEILYPTNPGSIYHMTKSIDQVLFQFYAKNDGLRITDLHQGIVWGTHTPETSLADDLINRFDYDGDFGTVLNRFLIQAAVGHDLTVYGTGMQKRAFININDSLKCIEIALKEPPARGERVRIRNQMTECHRVIHLAGMVSLLTGARIGHFDNPRVEAPTNELAVSNDSFVAAGLKPIKLTDGLMMELTDIARRYRHRCDLTKIPCRSRWVQ